MNTESVLHQDDEPQAIVRWFPPAGAMRTLSNELGGPAALAVGLLGVAAVAVGAAWFLRRSLSPELKALKVDRLVVRDMTLLENAARYQ